MTKMLDAGYTVDRVTREYQKELLENALQQLTVACALSQVGSEFALDGAVDQAVENLQLTVDRHFL